MTLTVLTDDQIRSLLESLTVDELEGFRQALASALYEYSTGATVHQPERISVHSTATGATTLFMPSSNSAGNGIKGMYLLFPSRSLLVCSPSSHLITLSSASNQSPSTTAEGTKPVIRPTGAVTLFDAQGAPLGLLHASTLTAFRTALSSLCLVRQRAGPLETLAVFGCGEQAYWHVRLTLLARGTAVRKVVFINRRVSEASKEVLRLFESEIGEAVKEREGWKGCAFEVLTRDEEGYERRVEEVLREADVVFCCTPSTEPLFDGRVWASEEGRRKGRLVVAIGSYTPDMREVPGELIREALGRGEKEAGVVVVDTIEGVLKEAGELIEAGVSPAQLVELGELLTPEGTTPWRDGKGSGKAHLTSWLQTGNVIYKCVGFGIMDLSVGIYLVEYAKGNGVGTHVQGF
ncbi:hypothetical protein C8A03DRAFT_11005 [Achaetomium macrosporum]|uniref:Ornithine cyclodeaminase n=1 Tax=Achaetomium macrosporum TaxID=79813 RepID=A0AAN7HHY6_9PEZI|nr:hypothetical protein C8A03DRAFT_11005 [Achaetomium macrosporum]